MSDQLERIKEMHTKANELYAWRRNDDKTMEILMELFGNGQTDWLIEQVEKFEKLQDAWFSEDFTVDDYIKESEKIIGC